MITLFCNEEQKKKEFFGSFLVSLFSLFSPSRALAESVFSCFSCFCVAPLFMHFFSFSLSFILFGNHLIRITALYFLSSLVFIHYTLYINTHTRTL